MLTHLIVSDLHLGAETSLLTELGPSHEPLYGKPSAVLLELAARMRSLVGPGEQPTIILAGDVLELALANTDQAAKCFECLLDALFPAAPDVFSPRVLYMPGNHDHHVWEMAREDHYAEFLQKGGEIEPPWHVTRMYERADALVGWPHSRLLDALARRHAERSGRAQPIEICVVYPNFGLISEDGTRSVIVSHGHFVERLYHLMSELRAALFPEHSGSGGGSDAGSSVASIVELEAENFAWIDFFWSTMGRSGSVGDDVQYVYELASHEEGRKILAERLSRAIVRRLPGDMVPDRLEAKLLAKVLGHLAEAINARERALDDELGEGTRTGLLRYVGGPLYQQVAHERRHVGAPPEDVTFVFGHTHKPLERVVMTEGFVKPVEVFNTGGWVIDMVDVQPNHGAALVVVDDRLNVASIRLFNEVARGATPRPPSVAIPHEGSDQSNPVMDRLRQHLVDHAHDWSVFSAKVGSAAEIRSGALARRSRAAR